MAYNKSDMNDTPKPSFDIFYEYAGHKFVWNSEKARLNFEKRGIAFEEAATAIIDEFAYFAKDDTHSGGEERFKAIGFSAKNRMLTVCHCIREDDTLFRVITAWKATGAEKELYKRNSGKVSR